MGAAALSSTYFDGTALLRCFQNTKSASYTSHHQTSCQHTVFPPPPSRSFIPLQVPAVPSQEDPLLHVGLLLLCQLPGAAAHLGSTSQCTAGQGVCGGVGVLSLLGGPSSGRGTCYQQVMVTRPLGEESGATVFGDGVRGREGSR